VQPGGWNHEAKIRDFELYSLQGGKRNISRGGTEEGAEWGTSLPRWRGENETAQVWRSGMGGRIVLGGFSERGKGGGFVVGGKAKSKGVLVHRKWPKPAL